VPITYDRIHASQMTHMATREDCVPNASVGVFRGKHFGVSYWVEEQGHAVKKASHRLQ
jgi:hypothetical protein